MGNLPLRPFVAPVNGTTFRGEHVLDGVTEGLYLSLEGEPDNQYDPHAIKVLDGDRHLGYLPKDLAARMDADEWEAVVVELYHKEGHVVGIRIECRPAQADVEF